MTAPVLSIGETLVDLIAADGQTDLENVETFVARPGGAPANAAVALARLGVPAAFCGVIGNDPFGNRLRRVLSENGVDTSRLRSTGEAETTLAFAWKDERGDGHFRLLRLADRLLNDDDIDRAGIPGVAAVVVGSVALAAEPSRGAVQRAVRIAADAHVPVVFDVNLRPTLWTSRTEALAACEPIVERTTLLKLSLDDARALFNTGDDPVRALDRLAALGRPFSVLTDGARGAWFAGPGAPCPADSFVPAFAVEAVEPTGAGDAFGAALVSRLMANCWSTISREDVEFASAAGALTTTRRGAIDSLPTKDEIDRFLAMKGAN